MPSMTWMDVTRQPQTCEKSWQASKRVGQAPTGFKIQQEHGFPPLNGCEIDWDIG